MKRNSYYVLIVLFILSACTQPEAAIQPATATQGATATMIPTNTWTPEPTPTPEPSYKINANFPEISLEELARNYDSVAKEFTNITLEDITSGKLLEYELAYIAENPVFTDEAECNEIRDNYFITQSEIKIYHAFIHSNRTYAENPAKRPIKIISYFPFDDKELFAKLGIDPIENNSNKTSGKIAPNWPIWMATWAYHNPSGKTTLGLSLTKIFAHIGTVVDILKNEREQDFRPLPFYKIENVKRSDEEAKKNNDLIMYFLWKQYPELKPDEGLIKEWIKTMEMPEELQNDLFLLDWYPFGW